VSLWSTSQRNLKKGPKDGSCPAPVAEEERRRELPPLQRTRALEEQLIATDYQHPQGDGLIDAGNDVEVEGGSQATLS